MNNEQGRQSAKYAINIASNVSGTGSTVYASGNEVVGEDDIFNNTTVVEGGQLDTATTAFVTTAVGVKQDILTGATSELVSTDLTALEY